MRIFGAEKITPMIEKFGFTDDEAIESKMVSKSIENAQKKVEGNNFDIRKTLLGYDDVMNMQREVIYKQRSEVLEGENLKDQVQDMLKELVDGAVDAHLENATDNIDEEIKKLLTYLEEIFLPHGSFEVDTLAKLSNDEIKEAILKKAKEIYEGKELEFGEEQIREIERVVLLRVVDTKWMDHIDSMDHLKQGIGLRAYKQQNPTQAYQFEGSAMFEEMIENIKVETIKLLFHVRVEKKPERERVIKETGASHGEQPEDLKQEPVKKDKKVGRNDPCPCGSGKKYKNCHGRTSI